jgi:hypothetical protein
VTFLAAKMEQVAISQEDKEDNLKNLIEYVF